MNTVTVHSHGNITCDGPEAVELFRLITLRSALKLEIAGMRLSRGRTALAVAKEATGLKTNDRARQLAAVETLIEQQRGKVEHRDERLHPHEHTKEDRDIRRRLFPVWLDAAMIRADRLDYRQMLARMRS